MRTPVTLSQVRPKLLDDASTWNNERVDIDKRAAHGAERGHGVHADHLQLHSAACGHATVRHEGHVDFIHQGHVHAEHEGHWDECAPAHLEHADHAYQHGEGCGLDTVVHADHVDYVHGRHYHAAHASHLDEH